MANDLLHGGPCDIPRRIVCAANRAEGEIICSARHFDPLMRQQMKERGWYDRGIAMLSEQGFICQFGEFWTREEAVQIAENAGQLNVYRKKTGPAHHLFSEDLY